MNSGDLGATYKVFQLVLLFSLPSKGAGTQRAGFFQDLLGETVFFLALSAASFHFSSPWASKSAAIYLLALNFYWHQLCAVVSSSGVFGHVAWSHFLFLACILVMFRQREKNGCVSASKPAAWLLGFHTHFVQLFRQRHGIVYFPYRCFCAALKWKLVY